MKYKKPVENAIQAFFALFGVRLFRLAGSVRDRRWLRRMDIRTVIDIGASNGKSAEEYRRLFPDAEIFSFEPLPECFALLKDRMKDASRFHAFNIALSDAPGMITMQRSSYAGSSSIRKMADLHKDLFPFSAGQEPLSVATNTLDQVLANNRLGGDIMMKIDVQGFEDKVLAGATQTLQKTKVIIIETSFKELYTGQPLFADIYGRLTGQGFAYMGAWDPDFRSPEDGASLQQDAIFMRP